MGRRRGRDFGGYGGHNYRYYSCGYKGDGRCRDRGNPKATDLPQQETENKVVYEDLKISSEIGNNESEMLSVTNINFVENDATELEIVSAANSHTTTTTTDEITTAITQDIELDNEDDLNDNTILISTNKSNLVREVCFDVDQQYLFPQRSGTSLSVRSELCNVSKSHSSKTKETNTDSSWNSCFELHLDFDKSQNPHTSKLKSTATSLEILHTEENVDLNITRTLSVSGQKLASASNENFFIELNHDSDEVYNMGDMNKYIATPKKNIFDDFYNGTHRASDDCLAAICGEASFNSRFAPRWRGLSLSVQNCNRAAIFTTSGNTNTAIDIGKVAAVSENNVLISDIGFSSKYSHDNQAEILLTAPKDQKTLLKELCDCIPLTELPSNLTPSSARSTKTFNDSVLLETLKDTSLSCIMLSDNVHKSECDFNQTQINREEYVKNKTNVEQNTKELSKDELKRHCFVTHNTIIYPVSHLEMQCFPNSTYQFKYEEKNENSEDTETAALFRDKYSQTKEPVVKQSLEDTNRAVSVLNTMLQRRLNNAGSQNGSFGEERLNSFYSTPPGDPKSPSQKILNIQSFTRTNNGLNDFVDRSDAPLPHVKNLSVRSEVDEKAAMVVNQQYECVAQEPKEDLKQYCHENNSEKTSQISGSDGRSTIRDRLPRGQTRKLASLFETMNDAASLEMLREMDHLKRRGKSVPPNIINKTHYRDPEINNRELFQDDLFLQRRRDMTTSLERYGTHLGLSVPCKRNTFKEQFTREKQIDVHSVRSIVNRFESVSNSNGYQNSPRAIQTDTTPRKPKSQKRYSQYLTRMLQPGVTNYKNIQNVQYTVDSNYNLCSVARSPSLRSDEWNDRSPSHNLPYDNTSCANVWDQQQYELGLRKGITSLKRYDSSYSRMTNEILNRKSSYAMQTRIRQINYKPEVQPSCPVTAAIDRLQKHTCEEKFDGEVIDHVAEVEKAFDFVNKTESLITPRQQCSQESLEKPSPPTKDNYSISLYRDLEREHRKSPNGDIPVHFSSLVYLPPPSADERLATHEHKNSVIKSAKLLSQSYMVTTDPMATSTPLDGSPAANSRMHTPASCVLNRSGISSITASTAQEIVQLQQSDIEMQNVKQEIMIQEGQIAQASLALAHCKKNSSFNGTLVELSAQRGLLLARERLLALQNEMQRLKTRRFVKEPVPPMTKRMRGAIDLTSIDVYLNRNFCIRNIDENVSYAFVILLKTDEQVEATQTVTLMDTRALRVSKVHFSDRIRFTNLPIDFTVLLEIYALKVSENRRSDDYSCSMLRNKAKSLLSPSKKTCGNESVVGFSEFICCGHICLNRDTIGMHKFYLDGAVYPLEGTIEIDSRCTTLSPTIEIDFQGFLTMYQIISGLGSWARYWAVLRCGVVQFWKYPDDEASEKPVLACMELSQCTNKEISHAPHEICSRPNAFTIDLLVPTSASLTEKKRVLLSADTKELCSAWLNALNGTLQVLRG